MKSKVILTLRWAFWAFSIAIMVFLFVNSAKPAPQSSAISKDFTVKIFEIFISNYDEMNLEEQNKLVDSSQFLVRKAAHLTAYFALGSCLAAAISTYKLKRLKSFLIPLAVSVLYAVSDEFHQIFVEGRAGRFYDVMIDTVGAFLGILVIWLSVFIICKLYRRKNSVRISEK